MSTIHLSVKSRKSGLHSQAGYANIRTRGAPTNGHLPLVVTKLLRPPLAGLWDGVISFYIQKLRLLASIDDIEDKRDSCNQNHRKCEKAFICNHLHHPLYCGEVPSDHVVPLSGKKAVFIIPDAAKMVTNPELSPITAPVLPSRQGSGVQFFPAAFG